LDHGKIPKILFERFTYFDIPMNENSDEGYRRASPIGGDNAGNSSPKKLTHTWFFVQGHEDNKSAEHKEEIDTGSANVVVKRGSTAGKTGEVKQQNRQGGNASEGI
jgi:hypothetical protein